MGKNKAAFGVLVKAEKTMIEIIERYQGSANKHINLLIHFVLEGLTPDKLEEEISILSSIKFRCRYAKVPENTPESISVLGEPRKQVSRQSAKLKK